MVKFLIITPSITLPGTGPLRKAKTPIITSIRSDESVLTYSSGAGSQPRIYLEWQFTDDSNTVQVRYRQTGTDVWSYVSALQNRATECYISGVKEGWDIVDGVKIQNGIAYDVQVRAVNTIGWASDWASISGHAVVGRTTPPSPPDLVALDGYVLTILMNDRPLDVVGFEVFIAMDDTDTFAMSLKVTSPYTADGKFDLKPWAGHARRYYVRAIDEVGLTSDLVSGLIDFGDVRPDNILVEYSQKNQNWPESSLMEPLEKKIDFMLLMKHSFLPLPLKTSFLRIRQNLWSFPPLRVHLLYIRSRCLSIEIWLGHVFLSSLTSYREGYRL